MVGRARLLTGDDLLLPPESLAFLEPKFRGLVIFGKGDSFAVEEDADEGSDSVRVGIIKGVGEAVWRAGSSPTDGFSGA